MLKNHELLTTVRRVAGAPPNFIMQHFGHFLPHEIHITGPIFLLHLTSSFGTHMRFLSLKWHRAIEVGAQDQAVSLSHSHAWRGDVRGHLDLLPLYKK